MGINILPDCRAKHTKNVIRGGVYRLNWVPIFCANCGADGGLVPEENCTFAFYLCQMCAERLGPITNMYVEPDVVFWQKVKEAQLEKYGCELTAWELEEVLKDDSNILTKLCKDRSNFVLKE